VESSRCSRPATFSAALVARLELLDLSDESRNQICAAAPHPELKQDLPPSLLTSAQNLAAHHEAPHRYLLGAGKLTLLQGRAVASMNRMLPQQGST